MRTYQEKLQDYQQWLQRVAQVIAAYQNGFIPDNDLPAYQLFILEFGQFNANFTLDEVERLKYPKSPFALMHRHTYLRGTESWAVEILRQWFLEKFEVKTLSNTSNNHQSPPSLYPIFLDSNLFWDELERYCVVIHDPNTLTPEQLKQMGSSKKIIVKEEKEKKREVNVSRWYGDDDITQYVDLIVEEKLGGYQQDCRFTLNKPAPGFTFSCILDAVDTIEAALPIDFYFDYTKQPEPHNELADHRADVFQDLFFSHFFQMSEAKVQILFPYNITNRHWLTAEIIISKNESTYTIEFFAHDPYGGGTMFPENTAQLKKSIQKRISDNDKNCVFNFIEDFESLYEARQCPEDGVSCGVIVARDIVCRSKGESLTRPEGPFPKGATELRQAQLDEVKASGKNPSFVKRNTVLTNEEFNTTINSNLSQQIWIQLNQVEDKKVSQDIIREIVENHVIDQHVPQELQLVFKQSQYSESEKNLLGEFLKKELEDVRSRFKKREKNKEVRNEKWYAQVFALIKKHKTKNEFLTQNNIKKPRELEQFFQTSDANAQAFEDIWQNISQEKNAQDLESNGVYGEAIKKWVKQKVDPLLKKIYYFVPGKFMGVDTLILVGHSEAETSDSWGPKTLINNLGYRLDPVRAMRKILERFPKLFIDEKETLEFWAYLIKTPMVKELKEKIADEKEDTTEQELIKTLSQEVGKIKPSDLPIHINLIETQEYKKLCSLSGTLSTTFNFYAQFMSAYASSFSKLYANHTAMQYVVTEEIIQALKIFIAACQNQNMSQAVRAIQIVTEILRLDLSLNPLPSKRLLTHTIKTKYLFDFPVQSALMTTYGMRSYARVLQADERFNDNAYKEKINIFATNQNYFEWLCNLGLLNQQSASVIFARHLTDIDFSADLIFMEIHPNNFTELKQFAQDILQFIKNMKKWDEKKRTLVFDATLNAFDDGEVQKALQNFLPLINSGFLNIILLQSLTKFSQIGVDERSGGVMVVINNGESWKLHNQRCNEIAQTEFIDDSTLQYFSWFFDKVGLTKSYIQLINKNVHYVYQEIMRQISNLEVGTRQRFQLTLSSDTQGCYVALNMRGLLPSIDPGFRCNAHDIEKFGSDIINHLLMPLCEFYGLPLTQRMSIAFPLSSINNVLDSIRFTIGLEPTDMLKKYAEIIAYISFVLNRFRSPQMFFEKDEKQKYTKRFSFFLEKINQFKAMTPGSNHPYELTVYKKPNETTQSRKISFYNGQMVLVRQEKISSYSNSRIYVYLQGTPNAVSLQNIDATLRRMVAACFTTLSLQDDQPINLTFDDFNGSLTLGFNIVNLSSARMIYGPFKSEGNALYFQWFNNQATFFHQGYGPGEEHACDQRNIDVKQGEMIIPFEKLPLEERDFLFKAGGYEPDRNGFNFMSFYGYGSTEFYGQYAHFKYIDYQHIPLNTSTTHIQFSGYRLLIERDFPCVKKPGITVYKRFFDDENTGIEIDYWKEKNPIYCRFFCFVIALCVKEKSKIGFRVRGYYGDKSSCFTHFLFHLAFTAVDAVFSSAIDLVLSKSTSLLQILESHSQEEVLQPTNVYQFFNQHDTCYHNTDAYNGQNFLTEGDFVEEIVKTLDLSS